MGQNILTMRGPYIVLFAKKFNVTWIAPIKGTQKRKKYAKRLLSWKITCNIANLFVFPGNYVKNEVKIEIVIEKEKN